MNAIPERLTAKGSPFELVEANLEGVTCKVFRHAPKTLLDIYRRAQSCGERAFLVCGNRTAGYGEILRISGRISRAIQQTLADAAGARIAVILGNGPEWIAAFIAITSMGATAVAVHRASPVRDMVAAIEMAACATVVCDDEVAGALRGELDGTPFVIIAPLAEPVADAGSCGGLTFAGNDFVRPESVAMIAFTSGSTSRPKGVELTHRSMTCGMMNALLGGALASAGSRAARQGARHLPPMPFLAAPFSHVSGYGTALLGMYVGGKMLTLERWEPKRAVEFMLAERATSLIGATSQMLGELLQQGLTILGDVLRSVVVQGSALPQGLLRELKAALPQVAVGAGYGLTETNGSVCMGSEAELRERPATSGRALPTVDLMIRGSDGTAAAPGEVGEVAIRGAMLMRGYTNLPHETDRALQDGWFGTGDLGWVDGDGFLYLADRASHFVSCGGEKVPYSAVERVVLDNKLAAEVAVFGAEEGSQAEGFVLAVSCPQESHPTDSAIADALRSAGYGLMAPRIVRLSTSLPRTPSGKIDRRELRRRVLAGEAR